MSLQMRIALCITVVSALPLLRHKTLHDDLELLSEERACGGEPCEERHMIQPYGWVLSDWSSCNLDGCSGVQTRNVTCGKDVCTGHKPDTKQACHSTDPKCGATTCATVCSVRVFGGKQFNKWNTTFTNGMYDYAQMEAKGAECQDISSIEVIGKCCKAYVFDYGDCNVKHKDGWKASFPEGRYDASQMARHGAKDNDISCLVVMGDSAAVVASLLPLLILLF